jgi:hypothetical protein
MQDDCENATVSFGERTCSPPKDLKEELQCRNERVDGPRVNFAVFLVNTGDVLASKTMMDELLLIATEHHGADHPLSQRIAGLADQLGSMLEES